MLTSNRGKILFFFFISLIVFLQESNAFDTTVDSNFGEVVISTPVSHDQLVSAADSDNARPNWFGFFEQNDNGTVNVEVTDEYAETVNYAKRTDVRVCARSANHAGVCIAGGAFGYTVLKDIANGIKSLLNQNNCKSDMATIHVYSDVNVYWKADEISGACDTTAQVATIEGALDEFIGKKEGKKICNFQCLKLTHGGKWTFYLKFGTDRFLVEYTSCNSKSGEYLTCTSGGKNSVGKNL